MSGMNTILSEQNVHIDEAIKKLKECELKTIQSFSQTSEFAANYVDDYFKDVIAKTPMVVGGNEFKPSTTVVMKFKDTWVPDHTINLGDELKDRKMMGFYRVRIIGSKSDNSKWFCSNPVTKVNDAIKSCNTINWRTYNNCVKCKKQLQFTLHSFFDATKNYPINHNTKVLNFEQELFFEIDNYLNMYEPKSKLYILFKY